MASQKTDSGIELFLNHYEVKINIRDFKCVLLCIIMENTFLCINILYTVYQIKMIKDYFIKI